MLEWEHVLAQDIGYYSMALKILSCVQSLLCPFLSVFHELNILLSVNKYYVFILNLKI